jgi:aspartate-semialdehyde dehydrogenase
MPAPSELLRVVIVGASSLSGRELKQVLDARNFPATSVALLDPSVEAVGTLTEAAGEPTFIQPLDEDSFLGARFVFFAGPPEIARHSIDAACRSGATVIDLSVPDAGKPGGTPWIPALDAVIGAPPRPSAEAAANPLPFYRAPSAPVLIASGLAVALAPLSPARVVLLLFPPVSERGQPGVDELESQTAELLSFRSLTQGVFGVQVAFNLMAGTDAGRRICLETERNSIVRETAGCLAARTAVPAIRLIQAPVFYGYAFSGFVEFPQSPDVAGLEAALRRAGFRVVSEGESDPSNVSVAGEDVIHVGRIEPDPSVPNAVWLWGAADNLRVVASNAVRIAEVLLAS